MRSDPEPGGDLTAFVAGRWPVAVRTLVLLGAPVDHAPALAADAATELLVRWSRDRFADLDAELLAGVVETWERDRTPWWRHHARVDWSESAELLDVLGRLDVLTSDERARVVGLAVSGLGVAEVDDVLGPGSADSDDALVAEVARLAPSVPVIVGPVALEAAATLARERGRHQRVVTTVGAVLGLAVLAGAVALGVRTVDPQPGPAAAPASTPPTVAADPNAAPRDIGTRSTPPLRPVAWYDGRAVHLAGPRDRTVRVAGVRGMVRVSDGVVVVEADGGVLHVHTDGTRERLGRTSPDGDVAAEDRTVAWTDAATGDLVLRRLGGSERRTALPTGARVVAVDAASVYVDGPGGAARVHVLDLVSEPAPAGVLDVDGGTVALQQRAGVLAMRYLGDGLERRFTVDGVGAHLSDDGRLLLTGSVRAGSSTPDEVVDLQLNEVVRIPLSPTTVVIDGVFSAEGQLTLVVNRSNGLTTNSADRPRGTDYGSFDLVVCDLGAAVCRSLTRVFDSPVPPVLAH